MHHRKWPIIITFLAPTLLLYAVFVVWPYLQGIYISLTDWQGFTGAANLVWLANYGRMLQDPTWRGSLLHNVIFLIVLPIATLGLAMLFAGLLTQGGNSSAYRRVRGSSFYRIVYFFPYVLPVPVTAILWQFIYTPGYGLLDGLLRLVHLTGLQRTWLADTHTTLGATAAVAVWMWVGFYMVLFIAAIQGIPKDIFEAAAMDGAGRVQSLFRITVPLVWGQVQVALVYVGIAALDMFALVNILFTNTGGGPNNSSEVMADYLYRTAFNYGQWGYASSMGVALFLISLLLAIFTFRFTGRDRVQF